MQRNGGGKRTVSRRGSLGLPAVSKGRATGGCTPRKALKNEERLGKRERRNQAAAQQTITTHKTATNIRDLRDLNFAKGDRPDGKFTSTKWHLHVGRDQRNRGTVPSWEDKEPKLSKGGHFDHDGLASSRKEAPKKNMATK